MHLAAWLVSKNVIFVIVCLIAGVYSVEDNCEQRNVTAAKLDGHICQNACETKTDCRSAVRKCVCDGLCGKSCVRTLMKCKKPRNPVNGRVHYGPSLKYGTVIKYSCDQGYTLTGSDSRICRGHGKWDKQSPVCERTYTDQNPESSTYKSNDFTTSKTSHATASTNPELLEATTTPPPDTVSPKENKGETSNGKRFIGSGIWDIFQKSDSSSSTESSVSGVKNHTDAAGFEKLSAVDTDKECLKPPIIADSIISGKNLKYIVGTEIEYKCNYGFFEAPRKSGHRIITKTRCILDINLSSSYWTELNMICKKKSCSHPGDILHGKRTGFVFTVGDEVKYECEEGYELIGRPVIFCTPSAKWNRSPPKCQAKKCPVPDNLDNGSAKYDNVDYLSIVSYTCSKSYTLIGNKERRCLADKTWSGSAPTCQVVQCEPPVTLTNGKIEVGNGPIDTGYIITFQCNVGSSLVGSSTSRCLQDGTWSFDLPVCKATCVSTTVANGEVFVKGDELASGESTIDHDGEETLECDDGYQVSNTYESSADLLCTGGNWYPADECLPASCSMFVAMEMKPSGTRFINPPITSMLQSGGEIEIKCRSTHASSSSSDHHALACHFGEWEWLNDDEISCQPKQCVVTDEDIRGKNYKNMYAGKEVSHKEMVEFKCQDNYEIINPNAENVLCKYGSFVPWEFPQCEPKMCATFKVENGVDIRKSVHGTKIEISCDDTYVLKGSKIVSCEYGSWTPYIPSCVKASSCSSGSCDFELDHKEGSNFDGSFCTYHFTDHRNVFTDINGGMEVKKSLRVPSGTTVKSRCMNRSFLKPSSGSYTSKCQDGTWIPSKPLSCISVQDDDIVTPFYAAERGSFLHSADGTIIMLRGSPLKLICFIKNSDKSPRYWGTNARTKYRFSYDGSSIVYKIDEIHSDHAGIYRCYKTDKDYADVRVKVVYSFSCPDEVPWESTDLKIEINEYLSQAHFSCVNGYHLEGDGSAYCNKLYNWESHDPPYCHQIQVCQKPDIQDDSNLVALNAKNSYSLGERLSFSCSNNYRIKNSYHTIQCTLYGWNNEVPTCVQGCPRPSISKDSSLLIRNDKEVYFVGERLRFSCQNNYKIRERYQVIFCLPSGWNKPIPTCIFDEEKG